MLQQSDSLLLLGLYDLVSRCQSVEWGCKCLHLCPFCVGFVRAVALVIVQSLKENE